MSSQGILSKNGKLTNAIIIPEKVNLYCMFMCRMLTMLCTILETISRDQSKAVAYGLNQDLSDSRTKPKRRFNLQVRQKVPLLYFIHSSVVKNS